MECEKAQPNRNLMYNLKNAKSTGRKYLHHIILNPQLIFFFFWKRSITIDFGRTKINCEGKMNNKYNT